VTIGAPKSPTAEAYRTLRSNIRFALFDQPAKSFVVCSAGAGEGKSLTAANLAVACAQGGDAVILVDTDLRRPVLHRLFKSEASPGLTNALVGEQTPPEVLHDTAVPGLRLLPTGPLPPNPAELLDSQQMDEVIAQLSSEADIIILDSPPALMLTDAGILASKVDRTIVVAEAGQITERAFADLMRIFEYARADVLGVVLNKLRVGAGDYYYYYYSYYDYDEADRRPTAEAGGGRLETGNDEPPRC
jgi:capsular exopolysaccharide synthesis family protein